MFSKKNIYILPPDIRTVYCVSLIAWRPAPYS